MFATVLLLAACFTALVAGQVGSQCSAPLGPGNALPRNPFWLESIKHQGKAAFNPNPDEYPVFRDVKDFGAIGDGVVDDTAAINNAISAGGRCGQRCESSTTTPALVYFPKGKYLVSSPIIALYYTQLIGDAKTPPTLLASPLFDGIAVIDADPYIPGGGQYYVNQNNLQGSTESGNSHIGLFMENGSGGYMGGKYGLDVGNQQFTVRNITVNNADTAIFVIWNWGWTFQGVTINNCQVGFDLGSQSVEAEAIIDAVVIDTPVFIRTPHDSDGKNYKQDCADTHDCQNQIVTVDSNSSVYIYSLSTVATTFQISVNERGVIHESGNHRNDRLASTVTLWYAT